MIYKYDILIHITFGLSNDCLPEILFYECCLLEKKNVCKNYLAVLFDGNTFFIPGSNFIPIFDHRVGYKYFKENLAPTHQEPCHALIPIDASCVFSQITPYSKLVWNSHGGLGGPFNFESFDEFIARPIFDPNALGYFLAAGIRKYNNILSFSSNPDSCLTIDLVCCDAGTGDYQTMPGALSLRHALKSQGVDCNVIARNGAYQYKGFVESEQPLMDRKEYVRITEFDNDNHIISEVYRKAPHTKLLFTSCKACGRDAAFWVYEYASFLRTFLVQIINLYCGFDNPLISILPFSHNPYYLICFLVNQIDQIIMDSRYYELKMLINTILRNFPICHHCFAITLQRYFRDQPLFSELSSHFTGCCYLQ